MSQTYPTVLYTKIVSVQDTHFWFIGRNRMIRWFVSAVIPKPHVGKTFLEVGCGTGIVMRTLEQLGFTCTGLDVNAQALAHAAEVTRGTLVRQSIFGYKPKEKFDVIGSFDVLEHIQEDVAFLRVCHTLLKPQGHLLLTVPAGMWLWSPVDAASGHVRRYEYAELVEKLTRAGFGVTRQMYWNVFLLPLYSVWHAKAGKHPSDVVAAHLAPMPRWLNIMLVWVFEVERILSTVIRYPIGATHVICAQKK